MLFTSMVLFPVAILKTIKFDQDMHVWYVWHVANDDRLLKEHGEHLWHYL